MPKLAALASAADNICFASSSVRLAYVRGMSPHRNTGRILTSRGPVNRGQRQTIATTRSSAWTGRSRVLAGDELAVLDHIRLEVDRVRAHFATRYPKRVDHVEVQL